MLLRAGCRAHLAEVEKAAKQDQERALKQFRDWAASRVEGAKHMNVASSYQLRQLLFAGTLEGMQLPKRGSKAKAPENRLEHSRVFKVGCVKALSGLCHPDYVTPPREGFSQVL